MSTFKKYNYSQSAAAVTDFEEQLQPGTLHKLIDNNIAWRFPQRILERRRWPISL